MLRRRASGGVGTGDVALALPASTLLDERREARERCRLFSADRPQLRHAQDEGDRRARADPRHTEHEREAPGQVGMALEGGAQAPQFVGAARLQGLDVRRDHRAQARIADVFEARLQPGNVRFDLFDEGQLIAERIQARIGGLCLLGIEGISTGGNQDGIDAVTLGPPQVQFCEGADLQRLQDDDHEAGRLQVAGDAAFIAAAGLDADALNAVVAEPIRKALPASGCILSCEGIPFAVDSDIEFILAGIDPCRPCDSLDHLRCDPAL